MAEGSAIEWTDHTFNPWIGCMKVGPGCDHCYAEALMDKRYGRVEWGGPRSRTSASTWAAPLKWQRKADGFMEQHGRRQRVFCSSLADVFDNAVDPQWRRDLADLIRATPALDWLLLTKRIGNVSDMLYAMFDGAVPEHVFIGATIVNQTEWDRDVAKIAAAAVIVGRRRVFLSMEPLLGGVWLETPRYRWAGIVGWVIVGGESGDVARMANPWAVRSLRDQCLAAKVPFLFKQWGAWAPVTGSPIEGDILAMDDATKFVRQGVVMRRMPKKLAGRVLDGATHTEFPA